MIPHSKPYLGEEEVAAAARVIRSGRLAQGAEVAAFEAECAALTGRRCAVAVSSGAAAIHLGLLALGIGVGDMVAMPSYACAALFQATRWAGAQPLLCDSGPDWNLNPDAVPQGVRAVILPHLFGAPARIPHTSGALMEDIAQSIGGETGKTGVIAIASFYVTKMLATGEGGMILTDDAALAEEVRDRRDYDCRNDDKPRFAYKMTDIQAAIGREQLKRLPEFVSRRRAIAAQYLEAFAGLPLALPNPAGHVFFRFVVATPHRGALEAALAQDGIEAKRPVYCPAHHALGGVFPMAERAHRECLSIPIYPAMTSLETRDVIECVLKFFVNFPDKPENGPSHL